MFQRTKPVKDPKNFEKAYEYAIFLLSLRLRTEGEMREKFRIRNYELGIMERVIEQLKEQRFVDDQRFAEVFLYNLKKYKTFGFYGIKKKMIEKRLPADLIESVLEEGLPVEEEMKIAERLISKQIIGIRQQKEKPQYQKLGFGTGLSQKIALKLKSKGFRSEVVVKMLF